MKNKKYDPNEIKPRKWLIVLLLILAVSIFIILADSYYNSQKNKKQKKNYFGIFDIFNYFESKFEQESKKMEEDSDEFEKDAYNSKFEYYLGMQSKFFLVNFLDELASNNRKNNNKIQVIYGELSTFDSQEISNIKNKLYSDEKYDIKFEYSEKGYVNKVIISEIEKNSEEFNEKFEGSAGKQPYTFLNNLINDIIINNEKTNNNHKIQISYEGITLIETNEINNMKNNLSITSWYTVSFIYGDDGYINMAVITKNN